MVLFENVQEELNQIIKSKNMPWIFVRCIEIGIIGLFLHVTNHIFILINWVIMSINLLCFAKS